LYIAGQETREDGWTF